MRKWENGKDKKKKKKSGGSTDGGDVRGLDLKERPSRRTKTEIGTAIPEKLCGDLTLSLSLSVFPSASAIDSGKDSDSTET